jgi:hypothetical protein
MFVLSVPNSESSTDDSGKGAADVQAAGPAQGSDPQELEGTALRTPLQVERELSQSRCDAVVPVMRTLTSSVAVISRRRCRSFAFLSCHHLHLREDFIRRQHPIHRNRVTPLAWATEP